MQDRIPLMEQARRKRVAAGGGAMEVPPPFESRMPVVGSITRAASSR